MTRRRGFAALAGVLGLGALAAGLADQLPASLRAVATLLLLLVLPAALLAPHLPLARAGAVRRPALYLSLAFLIWLCVLAVWTTAFAVAGVTFRGYALATVWFLVAGFGAAAMTALRGARQSAQTIPRGWYMLVLACALFAAAIPFRLGIGEDGLDHVGYVRRILTEDSLQPAGVLALPVGDALAPSDPRKGALHGVFALACWISRADPVVVWRWIAALVFPVAALAALAFNGAFLASRRARAAAAVLLLLTFDGTPFRFAGASAHGESLAALWCWVLTAAAVAAPTAPIGWPLWFLLAAGGVMIHLGVAVHVLVLVATLVGLGGAWGIGARERLRMGAAMAGGVALVLAVRRDDLAGDMNIIHAHTQGVLFVAGRWFVASPLEVLRLHGMLFLGGLVCVPALVLAVRARADARAILAASAIPFAVSFVPWVATLLYDRGGYMVFRSLLHVPVFAAMVTCAMMLEGAVRRRDRRAWFLGVPAAAVWLLIFLRPVPSALAADLRARVHDARAGARDDAPLIRAVAELPAGSVVLSDPATSYLLSAHTSHRFVATYQQHGNPRDRYALDRIRAVRDVLSPYVMPDVAVAACRRFGVNFVVVNGSPPHDESQFLSVWQPRSAPVTLQRMAAMQGPFARVADAGDAVIYRFDPAAPITYAWPPPLPPVAVGAPPLEPCDIAAPRDAFHVTGIAVSPARALPGDTLRVTLGYIRDSPVAFQPPVVVHLRFDHEVLSAGGEFPGEKQWRRLRDGEAGMRSRFREDVRPGHGEFEPDLWPVGYALCETFTAVVPARARHGHYRVEASIEPLTQVPNFHVRDLLYNRDHYSGVPCATLDVVGRALGAAP